MNTQVSSKPQVWTKWHHERLLQHEVKKPTSQLQNKRYGKVSLFTRATTLHTHKRSANKDLYFVVDCGGDSTA